MAQNHERELRVGLTVLAALLVLAGALLVIGGRNNIFVRKNTYTIRFASAAGLASGSAVTLDGVNVGSVERVILPSDPRRTEIDVRIAVVRRYAERLRSAQPPSPSAAQATKAHMQSLGLLGDKYIELNSGSVRYPEIPDEGEIASATPTNLEHLVSSGEDVMDNVAQISHSLLNILNRMDRGEGLLGELTTESATGRQLRQSALATMQSMERVADEMEHGHGVLPQLINDPRLANRLTTAVERLDAVLASAQTGSGPLPALLNDPAERGQVREALANLDAASRDLSRLANRLANGQGLVPKLMEDRAYSSEVSGHLSRAAAQLDTVSNRLAEGNGTAARLLNDPAIYDAINDIIVGVNRSWMLRWLIQNRQKAGIKQRYQDATGAQPAAPPARPATPAPLAPSAPPIPQAAPAPAPLLPPPFQSPQE